MNRKVHVRICEEQGVKSPLLTRLQAALNGEEPILLNYSVVALCIQALVDPFFPLIIQCKAIHGARIKNASTIRTVEKKDNIKFPKSASLTLNSLSIQDINQVFQKAIEVIK
jgi:hypothetical protein